MAVPEDSAAAGKYPVERGAAAAEPSGSTGLVQSTMAAQLPPSYRQPEPPPPPEAYDVRPRLESEQEYFTEVALQESRRWIEVWRGIIAIGNPD